MYVYTEFIYSNRDVYIAIAPCSSLLHSAIAIYSCKLFPISRCLQKLLIGTFFLVV
jgi:hypothetical protein